MKNRAVAESIIGVRRRPGLRSPGVHDRRERLRVSNGSGATTSAAWPPHVPQCAGMPAASGLAARRDPEPRHAGVRELRGLPAARRKASAIGGSTVRSRTLFQPNIMWDDIAPVGCATTGIASCSSRACRVCRMRSARPSLGCDGIILSRTTADWPAARLLRCAVRDGAGNPRRRGATGMTVIVDSGFRRGTDVINGARPGGRCGHDRPRHALRPHRRRRAWRPPRHRNPRNPEIDRALGQLGVRSLEELGLHLLKKPGASG